jgi:hypothetical protein
MATLPENHPSVIAALAKIDGDRIRGEASLLHQQADLRVKDAELEARFIRREAELHADRVRAEADLPENHPSVIAALAKIDRERMRLEADHIRKEAELHAEHIVAKADLSAHERRESTAPRRAWLTSAPLLAIAVLVLAALTSGLWSGSLTPLASVILAAAAAAFAVAYSAAILVSALRLVFGSPRSGPHPGAATALHLLVGADSTRQRGIPPE